MFDGLDDIAYAKKYTNIMLDNRYREFFLFFLIRRQVEKEFKNKVEKLDKSNPFYHGILEVIERKRDEDLEVIECYQKRKKEKFCAVSC